MTPPQDRKIPEKELYQEVNCNGKEMNKKEVNYGNVICGRVTTGSKGSNYGYSLKLNKNEEGNKDKE